MSHAACSTSVLISSAISMFLSVFSATFGSALIAWERLLLVFFSELAESRPEVSKARWLDDMRLEVLGGGGIERQVHWQSGTGGNT